MTIVEMFAVAVTTKSMHPGYMVHAEFGKDSADYGPYSKPIAADVAADLIRRQCVNVYLTDMATGEII